MQESSWLQICKPIQQSELNQLAINNTYGYLFALCESGINHIFSKPYSCEIIAIKYISTKDASFAISQSENTVKTMTLNVQDILGIGLTSCDEYLYVLKRNNLSMYKVANLLVNKSINPEFEYKLEQAPISCQAVPDTPQAVAILSQDTLLIISSAVKQIACPGASSGSFTKLIDSNEVNSIILGSKICYTTKESTQNFRGFEWYKIHLSQHRTKSQLSEVGGSGAYTFGPAD